MIQPKVQFSMEIIQPVTQLSVEPNQPIDAIFSGSQSARDANFQWTLFSLSGQNSVEVIQAKVQLSVEIFQPILLIFSGSFSARECDFQWIGFQPKSATFSGNRSAYRAKFLNPNCLDDAKIYRANLIGTLFQNIIFNSVISNFQLM